MSRGGQGGVVENETLVEATGEDLQHTRIEETEWRVVQGREIEGGPPCGDFQSEVQAGGGRL